MSEKDELRAAIEKAKAKPSPKSADSLAQQLGDEIARWRQNVEPAFKAAVKEANADLAEVPVRLRVYSWPFEFVYSAGLEKLPGLAVAADKNANKASQFASAVAGGSGSEGLAFSGPYVEAHLDHNGAVVVIGHRYAITHGGTFSLARFSNERIEEIVFEFAKLVAVPMGF